MEEIEAAVKDRGEAGLPHAFSCCSSTAVAEEAGTDRSSPLDGRPLTRSSTGRHGDPGWLAALALVALPALCCAGPVLVAALVASSAGAWLAGHGSLLALPAAAVAGAAGFWLWRSWRRSC